MAEVDEPQFSTLAERIAALNRQKNFQAPPITVGKRAPPPPPPNRAATVIGTTTVASPPFSASASSDNAASPQPSPAIPPRPTKAARAATDWAPPPLPRRKTEFENDEQPSISPRTPAIPNGSYGSSLPPPPLPSRNSQQQISPALPERRPSTQTVHTRRNSNSSEISYLSTVSSLSLNNTRSSASSVGTDIQPLRRLPPALDQAKLPPLPPTRRELEAKAREREREEKKNAATRSPSLTPKPSPSVGSRIAEPPSLPPRLPSRPGRSPATARADEPSPALPARRLPPTPTSYPSKSPQGFGGGAVAKSPGSSPPAVPLSSRPTFEQIDAVASRAAASPSTAPQCLVCRDYSGPDAAAAKYPISSLPRQDPVGYLAHVLCDPFPSHTDKARAIFTWCHHNIAYDVEGFFGGCIPRGQTTAEMIFSGKAVCEGYARVFEGVAKRAGLEVLVVVGHGKGYGFRPLAAGQPPPRRDPTGHAWNAVRIDGGEWKVIDACWGAGAVGEGTYTKRFAPEMFYLSNELIGLKHFPSDRNHFFRSDGRIPSWEEYIVGPVKGEVATWYSGGSDEGLSEFTFSPREKKIPVRSGEVVRFQFSKICEHWRPEQHGKGAQMLFAVQIHGRDGRSDDMVCMETDGFWYWADIDAADLGTPGQMVSLFGFDTLDNQSARGVTKEEFLRKKGRCGYSLVGIAAWDLV
ncbi:hypothetical protein B0T26DRAFT_711980 [Lasiosphaeria miniovina]|uniref:Transglutaminase-like domain-containing protein n=1 Tax=Lasiosphaeria miniovina TaxID=1954250 RepID=A0AA40DWG1_9PEZI|nr:uncharacterized protein B0T26DRAFT_711980 [Lasiosphaeria miniovina]KAK0718130.1 hypothetical protein B0T26DRAFT_711980 [Lasiosphaeria miniovina]